MASRSLNKVMLIGNLTRDPELRYTPSGTAVCTIGIATNRTWTTESGEKKEDVEYHRVIAWNKLAELCSQLLTKGRKVFVEGRLQTRTWQAQDGTQRNTVEIVIDDMILLDSRRVATEEGAVAGEAGVSAAAVTGSAAGIVGGGTTKTIAQPPVSSKPKVKEPVEEKAPEENTETINPDDIPF